ncbi:archease [Candidatus Pacearchaeota archaeon]|nr:archease [Candidatus Pacearchaeota archaeon]
MEAFEFLEHTADIKFQAFGKSLEEAFANSGLAMFNAMYKEEVKSIKVLEISCEGHDLVSLLYNYLEELIFYLDSENFFLSEVEKIEIDKENFKLTAKLKGDNAENYSIGLDVKAITYSDMEVLEKDGEWVTQVVLDV